MTLNTPNPRSRRTRTVVRALLLALALAAAPATVAATNTPATGTVPGTATSCSVVWGSLPESSRGGSIPAELVNLRTGRHECYDRLVVDLNDAAARHDVRYVHRVHQGGSGNVVPLRGGARLGIVVYAPAHDENYRATYRPANPREATTVSGYSTFRQVAWAGTFEGRSTIGLGVRARLPFRTFTLDGPGGGSRLVIDVAHQW